MPHDAHVCPPGACAVATTVVPSPSSMGFKGASHVKPLLLRLLLRLGCNLRGVGYVLCLSVVYTIDLVAITRTTDGRAGHMAELA